MQALELEEIYEALARQIDAVPAARRELFFAKLALLLTQELGDADRALALIQSAAKHLDT
ncbi:hypothetical protein [Mesobacterium pallidum]|uniref:hypothetical protein n=1 Tax=Mesobacterium pallidum TaxID=2872037 RepID=UPI001EE2C302|nr:hypothetical protein [Mesobacterium pallidum]